MARGNTCKVCIHDQRKAIDLALGHGKPCRELATKFQVSQQSLERHRARHLQPALARAAVRREGITAEALVDKLLGYIEAAERGVAVAEQNGDLTGLARCLKEAHAITLSVGKTIGIWSDRPQIVNDNRRQLMVNLDARGLDELLKMREGLEDLGVPALTTTGAS
jgi:hypothetical protein